LNDFSTCRRALSAGLAVLCLATPARAIHPDRAMSQYIRDQWGADQGFPGGPVYGITQASDGYLWVAAEKGLVRFDGLSFKLVEPPRLPSNSGSTVLGVIADPGGGVWARLRGPALLRYREGAFESIPSAVEARDSLVTAMSRGNNGAILVAAIGHGAAAYRDGRLSTIVGSTAMPSSFVISIAETPDRDVWIGTRDSALMRERNGVLTTIAKGLPDRKVNCLLAGDGHDLWIGTDHGVVRWNGSEATAAGLPPLLARVRAVAMLRDRDANVWIATASDGLLRVNAHGVTALVDRDRTARAIVTSLFEDREGNLWLGSNRGIERLRDGLFATYAAAQGLPADSAGPIYIDADRRTWFGPPQGGLYWLRDGQVGRVTQDGLADEVIYSIAGTAGTLWVGRQKGGLTRLSVHGDTVSARRFTPADGLAQNSVYSVYLARDGSVWAGTLSGGVSRYSAGVFTTYTSADGLASNTVASILESHGGMWFATPTGLSVLSGGRWRRYSTTDGLPSNDVNTLLEDSTGTVWAGTAAGLAAFPDGVPPRLALTVPAVLRGPVLGLADDRAGGLWVATADRVLRADRARLASGQAGEEDLHEFGAADGLVGVEGVKRHRSVAMDSSGRVWLSLNRGLSVADVTRAARPLPVSLAHIEEVSADGATLDPRAGLRLGPHPQRVTLSYTGLSLSTPERVWFRYRLDGYDREWSAPVSARQAVYTNLGPGPYRFRLIASSADGAWRGEEAAIAFDIAPAYWQTSWFRALGVISAALVGWSVYRLRVMQLAHRLNLRFEERLAERTRIAQDLHDTLLQGFVSASMQLHVATDRLPPDSDAKPALTRVLDLMARVVEDGRNAVRGLRPTGQADVDLAQALTGVPEELALAGSARYQVIVEGRPRAMNPLVRDDIYRIAREAVVNALRHSGARAIEVEIAYDPARLRVLIRDDGAGIDAAVINAGSDGHWGLPGMRERAEQIGGRLKVWSRAAAGTEVELIVPGHVAFERKRKDP
jgi:signal transduction histidine kinase/ligand-binding sensor domain-containing protein